MSFTPAEYADGVWTHPTRTADAGSPAPSDGSYIDDVAYAVWTYATRTASGGVATFSISVAETLQAPSQSATAQTVMPVTVNQTMPTPEQSGNATFIGKFEITVNQEVPAPSQSSILEISSVKPKGAGGPRGAWDYYPPIYTIRTKVREGVPAPSQSAHAKADKPRIIQEPIQPKNQAIVYGMESGLLPIQSVSVKSHRSKKLQRDEEEKIIMLLMGVA